MISSKKEKEIASLEEQIKTKDKQIEDLEQKPYAAVPVSSPSVIIISTIFRKCKNDVIFWPLLFCGDYIKKGPFFHITILILG